MRAIGYTRASTRKQDNSEEVQAEHLAVAADVRGWTLDLRSEGVASSKSMARRPVLAQALVDLKAGRAEVLLVDKLDRLSRNVADGALLLGLAQQEGWHVVFVDMPGVDTTAPTGRAMAHTMLAFAQMERELIGQRTREALAMLKAKGVRLGRPPGGSVLPAATAERIADLRGRGYTLQEIADELTASGTPTATGGQWWPATVRAVLRRTRPDLVNESEQPLRSLAEASGE